MAGDFYSGSICRGLRMGEFDGMDASTKKKFIRIMARISENSYRRGFQHGVVMRDRKHIDPVKFRFERSIEKSPFTDRPGGYSAIGRLLIEFGGLQDVGLIERGAFSDKETDPL